MKLEVAFEVGGDLVWELSSWSSIDVGETSWSAPPGPGGSVLPLTFSLVEEDELMLVRLNRTLR